MEGLSSLKSCKFSNGWATARHLLPSLLMFFVSTQLGKEDSLPLITTEDELLEELKTVDSMEFATLERGGLLSDENLVCC